MKSSPPEFSRSDVREWLNRVEDDFADNHRVVELANPVELPDTSWRCPLHWLQTFSNDGTYDDDARAPVPTRNSHFAHPTVLGFVRSIIARETACTKRSGRMQRSSECAGWRWLGGDSLEAGVTRKVVEEAGAETSPPWKRMWKQNACDRSASEEASGCEKGAR
jgi:hypothetical protein